MRAVMNAYWLSVYMVIALSFPSEVFDSKIKVHLAELKFSCIQTAQIVSS